MEVTCPLCGKGMEARKGQYGWFYGCTGYPACRGTRPMEHQQDDDECESFADKEARREEPFDWKD